MLITGDVSVAGHIMLYLQAICQACGDRPVYYVNGNHDYFGSSFKEVNTALAVLMMQQSNLYVLGRGEVIELSKTTALIGHRGWYDGLNGLGAKTRVVCPDRYAIEDFKHLNRAKFFEMLHSLGEKSADYFRRLLPYALKRYGKVIVATHVPPFIQGVLHKKKMCPWDQQPFFSSLLIGNTIGGISKRFPNQLIDVYAGHTHSASSIAIRSNVYQEVLYTPAFKPRTGKLVKIL